jgi:arginine exporter protein ArgO
LTNCHKEADVGTVGIWTSVIYWSGVIFAFLFGLSTLKKVAKNRLGHMHSEPTLSGVDFLEITLVSFFLSWLGVLFYLFAYKKKAKVAK